MTVRDLNRLPAMLDAAAAVFVALKVALDASLGSLSAYASLSAQLAGGSVHMFYYDGTLGGLGAAVDAGVTGVAAASGLSGAATVRVPLLAVATSNAPGLAGINAVFGLA